MIKNTMEQAIQPKIPEKNISFLPKRSINGTAIREPIRLTTPIIKPPYDEEYSESKVCSKERVAYIMIELIPVDY